MGYLQSIFSILSIVLYTLLSTVCTHVHTSRRSDEGQPEGDSIFDDDVSSGGFERGQD